MIYMGGWQRFVWEGGSALYGRVAVNCMGGVAHRLNLVDLRLQAGRVAPRHPTRAQQQPQRGHTTHPTPQWFVWGSRSGLYGGPAVIRMGALAVNCMGGSQ